MRAGGGGRGRGTALGAAAMAVVVAACGGYRSNREWSYDKPRVTAAQVDRDLAQCAREGRPTGPFAYPSVTGPDREAFNACMEKRGYTVTRGPAER